MATICFFGHIPYRLPIVVVVVAIVRVAPPTRQLTTLLLFPRRPCFLPIIIIQSAIDAFLRCCCMVAAKPTIRAAPAFLLR